MLSRPFANLLISLCIFIILVITVKAKINGNVAAVPRSKNNKNNMLGRGLFDRLLREVKISFSSELESVTLQVLL
jgi:hypothetical protein